jgi:hypothetical protein
LRQTVVAALASALGELTHALDVVASKQERARVDVSGLDESPRLLGTAARIRRLHQSALVVHEGAQITPRARQFLAEVVARDLQQFRSHTVGDAKDGAEDVDESLLGI